MSKRTSHDAGGETAGTTAALDRLFVTSPRDFVTTRAGLVASLRREGDASGAKMVAAARRPPTSAWALNVVAREHADAMTGYVDAAARLRAAQWETIRSENAGRFASARHDIADHEARVMALAKGAILGAGLPWTPDARRRISQTLRAVALAGHDDRARLLGGRLEADIDAPSDFEALAASLDGDANGPPTKGAARPAAEERAAQSEDDDRGARKREEREGEARRARERAAQAEEARRAREARAKAKAKSNGARSRRARTRGAGESAPP